MPSRDRRVADWQRGCPGGQPVDEGRVQRPLDRPRGRSCRSGPGGRTPRTPPRPPRSPGRRRPGNRLPGSAGDSIDHPCGLVWPGVPEAGEFPDLVHQHLAGFPAQLAPPSRCLAGARWVGSRSLIEHERQEDAGTGGCTRRRDARLRAGVPADTPHPDSTARGHVLDASAYEVPVRWP